MLTLNPPPGIPLPPTTRSRRSPSPHRLHRPLRQRPALLHAPPQRRHPRARAPLSRPRIGRNRILSRLQRLKPETRRQSRPGSRPAVRHLCTLLRRAVQHLQRAEVPQQRQELPSLPGHAAGEDQPPGEMVLQVAGGSGLGCRRAVGATRCGFACFQT